MTAMMLMNHIYIDNTLNKPSVNPKLNENDRGKGISLSGIILLNVNDIHFEGVSDAITLTGTNSHFVEIYGFHASHIGVPDSDTTAIKMADTYCHNIIFSGGRAYNCKWSNVLKNNTNLTNIPSIPYENVILRGFNIKSDINYKGMTHSFLRSIFSVDILSTNTSNGSLNIGVTDGNTANHYTLRRNGVNMYIERNGEIFQTIYDSGNEGSFIKIHHLITLPSRNTVSNIGAGNILTLSGKPVYTLGSNQYGFIPYYRKGSNTQRPSLSSTDSGELYYDTTLSKYIAWNGSAL